MNTIERAVLVASLAAACLGSGAAGAAIAVEFVKPESYGDMPFSVQAREGVLTELRDHFTKLGNKLAPGQDLKLEILDIDLAGRVAFSQRGPEDYRILRGGADWPSMRVRYSLAVKGAVIQSGEERLTDMDYMHHGNFYTSNTPLRYEKRMIDEWFKRKFLVQPD